MPRERLVTLREYVQEALKNAVYDKGEGLRVDEKGNLLVTGPDGIWVFALDGTLLGRLQLPEVPANLCFGGSDGKHLFITARTSVYLLKVNVSGARYW